MNFNSGTASTLNESKFSATALARVTLQELADQYNLTYAALERTVYGLAAAAKLPTEEENLILIWFTDQDGSGFYERSDPPTVSQWLAQAEELLSDDSELLILVNLTIGLAYMRERSQQTTLGQDTASISFIWPIIHQALTPASSTFKVSRSAGGFLFVPLCSLVAGGKIDELWRLHVWLPDGKRGSEYFGVHGHNTFGQSWILTGEGTNRRWAVTPTADPAAATHAEYVVAWDDGRSSKPADAAAGGYKTHQVSSTVTNTGALRTATLLGTERERRGMTYSIAASEWHSTEVASARVCATLFFFDAQRGFVEKPGILGPRDGTSSTTLRDPAGITPGHLAGMVERMRAWEDRMEEGTRYKDAGEVDRARESFELAVEICGAPAFPNHDLYSDITRASVASCS